jgi:hypothetical protein
MDYCTKLSEPYTIPNQKASTVAEKLVSNFCRFGVPRDLHSDQGLNSEFTLMQEIQQRLRASKTCTTVQNSQSDSIVERYKNRLRSTYEKSSLCTRMSAMQN